MKGSNAMTALVALRLNGPRGAGAMLAKSGLRQIKRKL